MSLLLVQADARRLPFADASVQCCITSPPYWGLRDYGTARWAGGDAACDHIERRAARRDSPGGYHNSRNDRSGATQPNTLATVLPYRQVCGKCGATRIDSQIGLEPTPDAYVATLVQVFREVWRVLKPDGVCWLNLGDSYANTGAADSSKVGGFTGARIRAGVKGIMDSRPRRIPDGLKPKDLVGIPWRVAFALQADGWYLRSDIIWSKPNPMPESVTDRPTKAHEYLFLLTKAERYYYDADAIMEQGSGRIPGNRVPQKGAGVPGFEIRDGLFKAQQVPQLNRNRRSVWHIATQPYPGAHFATMPEALIEPCILAGSRPGDLVLDPFVGSGTVARVAIRLGRRAVGCDLNAEYLKLAHGRTSGISYGLPLELGEDCA